MGKCGDCKHWERGLITVFHPEATEWDGRQHPWAGQTQTRSNWWRSDQQDGGSCGRATDESNHLFQAVVDGGSCELYTAPDFGCPLFEPAPEGWDHWRRWSVGPGSKFQGDKTG